MNTRDELIKLLQDGTSELGVELKEDIGEIAAYAEQRTAHLATITNEPGFDRAVRAERDSIALRAGINLTETATAADMKLVGLIHGGIRIAALALA